MASERLNDIQMHDVCASTSRCNDITTNAASSSHTHTKARRDGRQGIRHRINGLFMRRSIYFSFSVAANGGIAYDGYDSDRCIWHETQTVMGNGISN